jgi:DnaK suppressor protein
MTKTTTSKPVSTKIASTAAPAANVAAPAAKMAAPTAKVAREKQLKLQEHALLLKSQMSTTAAAVVAYQGTSGDDGDMSQQSEQEWLFLSQNRANAKELRLIESALRRIKDGSYGVCAHCGQPISPRRLQAVPWAEYCVDCQDGHGNGNGNSAAA